MLLVLHLERWLSLNHNYPQRLSSTQRDPQDNLIGVSSIGVALTSYDTNAGQAYMMNTYLLAMLTTRTNARST